MRALALLIALTVPAIAHAGVPIAALIPPVEVDVGTGKTSVGPSRELLAGVHWASIAHTPTRFDVGFGFVGSWREVRLGMPELRTYGPYVDLAYAFDAHRHWRTWVAGRFEKLTGHLADEQIDSYGVALRLQSEVFIRGMATASTQGLGGAVIGTLALGVYVEASHRHLPSELGPNGVNAGIAIRIPLLAGGGG